MLKRLTHETIVDTAVDLARRESFGSVSLRAVAAALGVTPMALYRHVADGTALRLGALDAIATLLPLVGNAGPLDDDLREWARAVRATLGSFAGVSSALMCTWFELPVMLQQVDRLLERADRAGVSGFDGVAVTNAVMTFVLMRVQAEEQVRSAGVVQRALNVYAAETALPYLRSQTRHYERADFDAHFEFGLSALLLGALAKVES